MTLTGVVNLLHPPAVGGHAVTVSQQSTELSAVQSDHPPEPTRRTPVAFESAGVRLAGNLFAPRQSRQLPGVVVAGTWTSVKEQMADRYAEQLASRGMAALSFDFSGFGVSGGDPRDLESAQRKVADLSAAITFLGARPEVDEGRLGALGVCAGAMYVTKAAIADDRIRALALVAPWIHNAELVRAMYGGPDGVRDRIVAAEEASEIYRRTGVVEYVPAVDADDPNAAMPMAVDFYADPDRGGIPGWPNRFAVMAWKEWLTLDAVALAPAVRVPTFLVHSREAAIPDGAAQFYDGLTAVKEIQWTTGDQFDFYDNPATVTVAAGRSAQWLQHHTSIDTMGGRS